MGLLSLEKIRLRVNLISVLEYLKGWCEENRTRLFPVMPSERTRDNALILKYRRSQLNIRKHIFIVKNWGQGDWTQPQLVWAGCGVSLLEYVQKLSEQSPGQTALSGTAWPGYLQGSLPSSTILWSCDIRSNITLTLCWIKHNVTQTFSVKLAYFHSFSDIAMWSLIPELIC